MEKKSIAALIVAGAMVLGLSACGTNGAASDKADSSQSTNTPVVDTSAPEPVSTPEPNEQEVSEPEETPTKEEVEETLGIELPPVEVFYVRDYDKDNNGTISKAEWEQWCADHPEDKNKNMTLKDEQQENQQQQQTQIPDTSGNPDPGSEQTSKPTTNPGTGTSTEKPSTNPEKPSTNPEKPSTNPEKPSTDTEIPGTSGNTSYDDSWTEQDQKEWEEKISGIGAYDGGGGAVIIPGL